MKVLVVLVLVIVASFGGAIWAGAGASKAAEWLWMLCGTSVIIAAAQWWEGRKR
jgi:hypothetical protein